MGLHRLAPARDGAAIDAKAVGAGCPDALDSAAQNNPLAMNEGLEAIKRLRVKLQSEANGLALFSVVLARAGHCAIP